MSKSYGNTIDLFAEPKALKKRVMGIVTDSTPVEDPKDPETCTVFALYQPVRDGRGARPRWSGATAPAVMGYGEAKKALHEKVEALVRAAPRAKRELAGAPGRPGGRPGRRRAPARAESAGPLLERIRDGGRASRRASGPT